MSEFVNTLKKAKWDSIVISVLTILLGLVYVLLPAESASIVTTLFGVAMILVGVTAFVRFCVLGGFLGGHLLVLAASTLIIGIFTLTRPAVAQDIVTIMLGIYIVIDSLDTIADGIVLASANIRGWIWMLITGFITAGLGAVIMFAANFTWVMIFAGVSLMVEGVRRLVVTLTMSGKVRQAKKDLREAAKQIDPDDYDIY